jgi:hypothetical protein
MQLKSNGLSKPFIVDLIADHLVKQREEILISFDVWVMNKEKKKIKETKILFISWSSEKCIKARLALNY